jgi:hypothetical protein
MVEQRRTWQMRLDQLDAYVRGVDRERHDDVAE